MFVEGLLSFNRIHFPLPIKCTRGLTDPPYIIHTSWPTHTHTHLTPPPPQVDDDEDDEPVEDRDTTTESLLVKLQDISQIFDQKNDQYLGMEASYEECKKVSQCTCQLFEQP